MSVSFDSTGSVACVACDSARAHLLDVAPDGHLYVRTSWTVGEGASTATESVLAIANSDRTVSLWSTAHADHPVLLGRTDAPRGHVFGLAFSGDGSRLAAASTAGEVQVWDVQDPLEPTLWASLDADDRGMYGVVFSQDDSAPVAVGADGAIRRWVLDADRAVAGLERRAGDSLGVDELARFLPPDLHPG